MNINKLFDAEQKLCAHMAVSIAQTATEKETFDLTIERNQGRFDNIRSLYVVNANNENLTIYFPDTRFELLIPKNTCGYYNVISARPRFSVSCVEDEFDIELQILNFLVPPAVWSISNE